MLLLPSFSQLGQAITASWAEQGARVQENQVWVLTDFLKSTSHVSPSLPSLHCCLGCC